MLKELRLAAHNAQKVIRKRRRENFRTFINDIEGSSVQGFWENIRKLKNCASNRQMAVPVTSKTDLILASIDKLAPSWCSEAPLNCTEIGDLSFFNIPFQLEDTRKEIVLTRAGGAPGPDLINNYISKLLPDSALVFVI